MEKFKIKNVMQTEIEGDPAVEFTIVTNKGSVDLLEWINIDEDKKITVETTDSHVVTNQLDLLAGICKLDYKDLHPLSDRIPVYEILGAVEEELNR
jgi:hypothetical protein